jgi:hypothetical protein
MSDRARRKATLLLTPVLAIALAACTSAGGGAGSPSAAPSSAPSPTADPNVIDHPTGATDVILRFEEGGGFVPPTFTATMVPHFTMYGDGTIVFRDPTAALPPQDGSIIRAAPMRIAKLTEEQVQDVLRRALVDGGLAVARAEYTDMQVADAPTATFTIQAGGLTKTVSVYALGIGPETGADAPARAAFAKLAESLTKIEQGGAIVAADYQPAAFRGVLTDSAGVVVPDMKSWPWKEISPTDFVGNGDPNAFQLPVRVMTPTEIDALGIKGYEGGLMNVILTGPGGVGTYSLSIRPLLPDESK